MNLSDLTISGVNQVSVTDSIAAPLFKLKIERSSNTVEPVNNQLVVFVDKSDYANPTDDLRRYVYDLSRPLKFLNNISDKFVLEIKPKDNDIVLVAKVERYIEDNDGTLSQLATMEEEILESFPICLFEGVNYIYTNYTNALIEVIYPKNNDFTKLFLNNAVYYNHKIKNDGEFSLDDIYFKDAFTKTEDKLNLEVNNASIDCLSSRNNNFSLDEEGNLIVNSISSNSENLYTDEMIVNLIYPIGSIYLSINDTNPSLLFGGVWERIKDKFLLASGDTYSTGATGGEATHTLTIAEMPSHTHQIAKRNWQMNYSSGNAIVVHNYNGSETKASSSTGGSQAHNNMPPYLSVTVWKRVS